MQKTIRAFVLIALLFVFGCMQDPTPEELGVNFIISTDKTVYKQGDEIKITFSNNGATEVRAVEALIKEGKSISYDKSFLFFIEILQLDGTWRMEIPYEYNYGSEFPCHLRPGEKKKITSAKISKEYAGNKIRIGLHYKDEQNNYAFTAYSSVIELLE